MTLRVVFELKTLDRAAGFLADDPDGLRSVLDAIDRLIDDPRPGDSFPFGSPDGRRLRVGRYRVLYRIDADVISNGHLARKGAGEECGFTIPLDDELPRPQ